MKIAIFGFNKFGEKIATTLKRQNVLIVVFDEEEKEKAKEKLFDVIELNEISDNELKKIEEIDYAICVLDDEEKNLFLVLSLKELFPNLKVVAKVNFKENEYKYKLAGADKLLNPYEIIANRIMTILKKPLTLKVIEEIIFTDSKLSFSEIEIPENSFLEGKALKDVYKEIQNIYNLLIIGIVDKEISDDVIFITKGINHILNYKDILVVAGDIDEIERFKNDLEIFKGNK
jgi:voltage-gated potassium channel